MMNFTIIDSPEKSFYFNIPKNEDDYENNQSEYFADYNHKHFINEFNKYDKPKKQAGYSKAKKCNYLSIVLVLEHSGDGEFNGHGITSTYLIDKDNKITDINNNCNLYGEVGHSIQTLYHPLPDGKIIELPLRDGYENNLKSIYEEILKVRRFYDLSNQLPEKPEVGRKMKN